MSQKKHVPVPKNTPAFFCANCGAVALDSNNICAAEGKGTKADWCGMKGVKPPKFCQNNAHNDRWQCKNCGTISVNPELLCEPVKREAT